jgi:dolichyldiphosphatase
MSLACTVQVPFAVLGSIINVVLCKALKVAINEKRPASAKKADPGMPSSHAQSECV